MQPGVVLPLDGCAFSVSRRYFISYLVLYSAVVSGGRGQGELSCAWCWWVDSRSFRVTLLVREVEEL